MCRRKVFWIGAGAVLAACGTGSQGERIAQPGLLPLGKSAAIAQHLARMGPSWMLPGSSGDDLVYVSNQNVLYQNQVYIFSYPSGKLVGEFNPDGNEVDEGMCSDASGDVWVLGWESNGQAFYDEYSHGGQYHASIIARGVPNSCAVDPKTGDLAVANFADYDVSRDQGDIAIYKNGSGNPADYYGNTIKHYYYCAYDGKGDLFADGDNAALNELAKGSGSMRNVYLNRKVTPGSMQWDGKYVTIVALGGSKGPTAVDRLTAAGSSARIVGTTELKTEGDYGTYLTVQFAIAAGSIIGPAGETGGPARALDFWRYPAGGIATKSLTESGYPDFYGVAFSVAPKGNR